MEEQQTCPEFQDLDLKKLYLHHPMTKFLALRDHQALQAGIHHENAPSLEERFPLTPVSGWKLTMPGRFWLCRSVACLSHSAKMLSYNGHIALPLRRLPSGQSFSCRNKLRVSTGRERERSFPWTEGYWTGLYPISGPGTLNSESVPVMTWLFEDPIESVLSALSPGYWGSGESTFI